MVQRVKIQVLIKRVKENRGIISLLTSDYLYLDLRGRNGVNCRFLSLSQVIINIQSPNLHFILQRKAHLKYSELFN